MQNWYVYIAEARTKKFYTGISNDPDKRLIDHNSGLGSKFAIEQGPLKLIYISLPYKNKSEARIREIQIKKWSREKKLKLINGIWK